jgi:hypothetical protein
VDNYKASGMHNDILNLTPRLNVSRITSATQDVVIDQHYCVHHKKECNHNRDSAPKRCRCCLLPSVTKYCACCKPTDINVFKPVARIEINMESEELRNVRHKLEIMQLKHKAEQMRDALTGNAA